LKDLYLEPLGLSVTAAAEGLGISRKRLSALINQRSGISPLMALRLSKAFPNTTAQFWLNLQNQFDLFVEQGNAALATVRRLAAA